MTSEPLGLDTDCVTQFAVMEVFVHAVAVNVSPFGAAPGENDTVSAPAVVAEGTTEVTTGYGEVPLDIVALGVSTAALASYPGDAFANTET